MLQASIVDARLANGSGLLVRSRHADGDAVPVERYLLWACTTSKMLAMLLSTFGATHMSIVKMVLLDVLMLAAGYASQLPLQIAPLLHMVSCICFVAILTSARHLLRGHGIVYFVTVSCWSAFPVIDMLRMCSLIGAQSAEMLVVIANYAAKVLYTEVVGGQLEHMHVVNEVGNALLQLVLPRHVIPRVRAGQRIVADRHEHVCVMFTDIVGFTGMCQRLPTAEIYALLNDMYCAFDGKTDEFGVYKVETIGDAYMAVAGHDGRNTGPPPVARILAFAVHALDVCSNLVTSDGQPVQIRVGVHCGPALSGVVGTKCPRYCFFGDTVNTASRMESMGVPGAIHVSLAVVDAHGNHAAFCPLGRRDVKGKGAMATFLYQPTEHAAHAARLHVLAVAQAAAERSSCPGRPQHHQVDEDVRDIARNLGLHCSSPLPVLNNRS